jgi:L-alanine-DL-glutamate epimerase-like enolase superfamily enzyme
MSGATISRIAVYRLTLPKKEPFRIALGTLAQLENILVRVESSDGLYGLGEGSPYPFITGETQAIAYEAALALARLLVGKDPYAIEARVRDMDRFLEHNTTAKSALDMALYDLLAKRAGLPLYALLGGEKRCFTSDETLSLDEPATMAHKARALVEHGHRMVKAKLGTGYDEDVARVRAIRDAIGPDVLLRVDANQGWDSVTAEAVLRDLASFDVEFCEQPVARWDYAAMRRLREVSPIPIMADESLFDHHDALRLASLGACHFMNIKLSKAGGLYHALQIVAVAEAAGILCMVGCMSETRLGLSAAAHLVSAKQQIVFADLDSASGMEDDPVEGGMTYDAGRIELPDRPGHGADVKAEVLQRLQGAVVAAPAL